MLHKTQRKKKFTAEVNKGKAITQPDKGLSVVNALNQYRAGTFAEQIKAYYDTEMGAHPDMETDYPLDISKLDRIEQMELLNEVKASNKKYELELYKLNESNERAEKHNKAVDKRRAAKQPGTGDTTTTNGSVDPTD